MAAVELVLEVERTPGWNAAVTPAVSEKTDSASARLPKVREPSSLAREETPNFWDMANWGLPSWPRLVVMMTTPLVALEP